MHCPHLQKIHPYLENPNQTFLLKSQLTLPLKSNNSRTHSRLQIIPKEKSLWSDSHFKRHSRSRPRLWGLLRIRHLWMLAKRKTRRAMQSQEQIITITIIRTRQAAEFNTIMILARASKSLVSNSHRSLLGQVKAILKIPSPPKKLIFSKQWSTGQLISIRLSFKRQI